MLKGIKVRLYLNKEQEQTVNSLIGSSRFVYNQCLNYKIERYKDNKTNTSWSVLGKYFTHTLRKENLWLQEHNTKILKQSIIDLEKSYKNFFKHNKGFPKFKSKHDVQSIRFPYDAVSVKTFDEKYCKLNLTKKIKGLKFECSNRDKIYLYNNKSKIKSVTITKTKTNKYFASILIDGELNKIIKNPTNDIIGIDLGIKTLFTFSNGDTIENPKWIRNNERRLKKLQKQLSKKQINSKNRNKARLKLAILHEKIKNKKQDFIHNITSKIINENQVIVIEDLNVSGMMKNHKLAKSISELGLYEIKRQLEYKSKWNNRELIFVHRFFPSSKICCECNWKNNDLTLKDREFVCQNCGNIIDRDLNASINIKNEGHRIYTENINNINNKIGQRLPEFTLEDNPTMDDKDLRPLKSSGWMIQENTNLNISV